MAMRPFQFERHDANLDRQNGLEEAALHNGIPVSVAIDYLTRGQDKNERRFTQWFKQSSHYE